MASNTSNDAELQPLIPSHGRRRIPTINLKSWLYPDLNSFHATGKAKCQSFLSSKYGHYSVLVLVSLDVSCIFADFIINLFVCEGHLDSEVANTVLDILDWSGLTFSSLFILELIASLWAFGTP
jgi:voltage-gated hydrogen channel 1